MSTNIQFAPGEQSVTEDSFSPSILLFWIKTHLGVSSTRVVTKEANTVLGIIPLGANDAAYPLTNVASVGVNVQVKIFRGILGAVLAIAGLASFGSSVLVGLILLLLGVSLVLNTVNATLRITNNAGGTKEIYVSVLEKAKLERFRDEVNTRLFADHAHLRHNEQMTVQNQQLHVQQQQLNAQVMQQNAVLQQQPPAPPTYQVGDVVNGHRFTGTEWVPVTPEYPHA
jgi:hypothetical protein